MSATRGATAATRIVSVVGARPNFVKLAPVARVLAARPRVEHCVVHTGQHFEPHMSEVFFRELGMPAPHENLGVGSGTHAQQTAAIMQRLEPVCLSRRPDLVIVYGDVNSTLAAALVAAKLGIRIAHVEAGLRSGDWTMPEEINRVVTDRLADLLFAPSRDAVDNLRVEGVPAERVHFVGNVMIDELVRSLPAVQAMAVPTRHGIADRPYVVVTVHRPANVDDPGVLRELLAGLTILARDRPVLFPVHPRTRERIGALDWTPQGDLRLLEPIPYLEMLGLVRAAGLVITDSGGLQEETTFLGVRCLTVRPNTERPVTCTHGTNRLVAATRDAIVQAARDGSASRPSRPIERWDGRAAERVVGVICDGERWD